MHPRQKPHKGRYNSIWCRVCNCHYFWKFIGDFSWNKINMVDLGCENLISSLHQLILLKNPNFYPKTCVFGEIVVPLRVILRKKSAIFSTKSVCVRLFLTTETWEISRLEASRTLDARGVYCSLPGMLRAYCALLHALVGAYTWCGFLFVLIEIKGFLRTSVVQ